MVRGPGHNTFLVLSKFLANLSAILFLLLKNLFSSSQFSAISVVFPSRKLIRDSRFFCAFVKIISYCRMATSSTALGGEVATGKISTGTYKLFMCFLLLNHQKVHVFLWVCRNLDTGLRCGQGFHQDCPHSEWAIGSAHQRWSYRVRSLDSLIGLLFRLSCLNQLAVWLIDWLIDWFFHISSLLPGFLDQNRPHGIAAVDGNVAVLVGRGENWTHGSAAWKCHVNGTLAPRKLSSPTAVLWVKRNRANGTEAGIYRKNIRKYRKPSKASRSTISARWTDSSPGWAWRYEITTVVQLLDDSFFFKNISFGILIVFSIESASLYWLLHQCLDRKRQRKP